MFCKQKYDYEKALTSYHEIVSVKRVSLEFLVLYKKEYGGYVE